MQLSNNKFPSDDDIVSFMDNTRTNIINSLNDDDDKHCMTNNTYISNNFIIPQEFRDSIFNTYFIYKDVIYCNLYTDFWSSKLLDYLDYEYDDCILRIGSELCSVCGDRARVFNTDHFSGFSKDIHNEDYCHKCYESMNPRKLISKNIDKMINNYLRSIFALDTKARCVSSTQIFDWLPFLVISRNVDDCSYLLINCNKDNKFYGYILLYGDSEFKIINHITNIVSMISYKPKASLWVIKLMKYLLRVIKNDK